MGFLTSFSEQVLSKCMFCREENLKAKRCRELAKVKKEIDVLEVKQTIVQQTKGERVEIDRLVAHERLISRKKAIEQKQSVKKAQIEAGQKIEVYRNARMQMVHYLVHILHKGRFKFPWQHKHNL